MKTFRFGVNNNKELFAALKSAPPTMLQVYINAETGAA